MMSRRMVDRTRVVLLWTETQMCSRWLLVVLELMLDDVASTEVGEIFAGCSSYLVTL